MLGLEGGIKWYFCPQKWVVQPHIGGLIQTNFLNLKRMQGCETHVLQQAYPGSHVQMNYDVQCPAIALKPKIGVDIRIISSVSLCFAYDIGFGLGWASPCRYAVSIPSVHGANMPISGRQHSDNCQFGTQN